MALADALRAARNGDFDACLATLIDAWRATRHPRIADAVDAVGERVGRERPPVAVGSGTIQKAWLKRAAQGDPGDMQLLLDTLAENVLGRLAVPRLAAIAQRDDPRLLRRLHDHLRHVPWRKRSSGDPYLLRAVDLLAESQSTESHAVLRSLADQNRGRTWPNGRAVGARLIAMVDAFDPAPMPVFDAADESLCGQIIQAAQAPVRQRNAQTTQALLDLVYAEPADLDARRVLADALTAQNDPRGRFIAMQIDRGDGPASRDEKRLLKQYEQTWLGPLADVAAKAGHAWRNGFVDTLRLRRTLESIDVARHSPAWSTVRTLDLSSLNRNPKLADFLLQLEGLQAVRGLRWADVRALNGRPVPWRTISGILYTADPLAALAALNAPNLTHYDLTWSVHRPNAGWLDTVVRHQPTIERLELGAPATPFKVFRHFPGKLREIVVHRSNGNGGRRGWQLRFVRASTTIEATYLGGRRAADPVAELAQILQRQRAPIPFDGLRLANPDRVGGASSWVPVHVQAARLGLEVSLN
jgi:uncharacterized protein (TIGR02996 family)